jgi:excisionase family DNA binding protein
MATRSTPAVVPDGASVYTQTQLAALTQLSVKTIQRMDSQGLIPGRIVLSGRSVRYDRAAVERWLAGRASGAGAE